MQAPFRGLILFCPVSWLITEKNLLSLNKTNTACCTSRVNWFFFSFEETEWTEFCTVASYLLYNILSSWNLSRNVFCVTDLYHEEKVYKPVQGSEQESSSTCTLFFWDEFYFYPEHWKENCSIQYIRFSEHSRRRLGSSFPPRASTSWWPLSAPALSTSCINQSFSSSFSKCWRVAHFQEPERLVPDKDSSTRTVSLWGNAICPSTFLTEKQKDTTVFNSKLLKKRKRENQLQAGST